MVYKSSQKRPHQILGVISVARAEALLTDWANLPGAWPLRDEGAAARRNFSDANRNMQRRYKDLLGDSGAIGHLWLRDMLRKAWATADTREREWICFRFRDSYASMVRREPMSADERRKEDFSVDVAGPRYALPPVNPIEAAVFHFQHSRNARHCRNVECPAPYFFANKKGQEFCSPDCVKPAQRESKRRWWNENRAKKRRKS